MNYNIHESQKHHAKRKKPDVKDNTSYDPMRVQCLKKTDIDKEGHQWWPGGRAGSKDWL